VSAPQDVAGCESNQTVQLQRKKPKKGSFAILAQVQTNAAGSFSTKRRIKKSYVYRAFIAETLACDAATSASKKVKLKRNSKR
jgi:hypothetical protein